MTVLKTGTILDKIIAHKSIEVEAAQSRVSLAEIKAVCQETPPPHDFLSALQKETVALIAEVKHASPSKGILIEPFNPVELAQLYEENGASAISVLTDEQFFMGHLDYLRQIRKAIHLPLLRKEFIVSPYQIYEARAAGADAVLLIVAVLQDNLLAELHTIASTLGMAVLVEVHDEVEMERALKIHAPLIGVNNRNLHDFTVDLQTTARLATIVPETTTLVGESGINAATDVLNSLHAILAGETIVKAADKAGKIRELSSVPRKGA